MVSIIIFTSAWLVFVSYHALDIFCSLCLSRRFLRGLVFLLINKKVIQCPVAIKLFQLFRISLLLLVTKMSILIIKNCLLA